jgi:hypothetical protein
MKARRVLKSRGRRPRTRRLAAKQEDSGHVRDLLAWTQRSDLIDIASARAGARRLDGFQILDEVVLLLLGQFQFEDAIVMVDGRVEARLRAITSTCSQPLPRFYALRRRRGLLPSHAEALCRSQGCALARPRPRQILLARS